MTTKRTYLLGVTRDDGDDGSDDRIVAAFDNPTAAKRERARLNKVRAERVAARAAELLGELAVIVGPRGGSAKYRRHDDESARRYAEYQTPRVFYINVPNGSVAEPDICVFRRMYEHIDGCDDD